MQRQLVRWVLRNNSELLCAYYDQFVFSEIIFLRQKQILLSFSKEWQGLLVILFLSGQFGDKRQKPKLMQTEYRMHWLM